jgi:UDP-N-acetylglucosamine/UDP-N-acetylgalactosamine diphosphorylase
MKAELQFQDKITRLLEKGVDIPEPSSIEIASDVDTERISGRGVVLYPGARLRGTKTLISSNAKIGYEAPATLVDCRLGRDVELKGGFFKDSLFLDRVSVGSGAQVREGCILEEESGANHTVGLKQTILFPFVTLGSLINFCDCFMAGGTSRKNHSEVGSSFIHFNYTPNQDKATPSLIGDVPRGVMLEQAAVFLGGQGGLVGPVRIGFGTVTAAGAIIRRDCPEGGKLLGGYESLPEARLFRPGLYGDISRRVLNNIIFMANLLALKEWYTHVRRRFFDMQEFGTHLCEGSAELIRASLCERLKRFQDLSEKMLSSVDGSGGERPAPAGGNAATRRKLQREFMEGWPELKACLEGGFEQSAGIEDRDLFIRGVLQAMNERGPDYITVIRTLDSAAKSRGTAWLQAIVDHITGRALNAIPSFRSET